MQDYLERVLFFAELDGSVSTTKGICIRIIASKKKTIWKATLYQNTYSTLFSERSETYRSNSLLLCCTNGPRRRSVCY
jgi:hypothetical protein